MIKKRPTYSPRLILVSLSLAAVFLAFLYFRFQSKKVDIAEVSTSRLPISGTFFMPDMPDSYITEANLKPMFDEMKEAGIDTLLGFSIIFDRIDSADPNKHTCDSVIHIRMPYLKMAHQYGMGVYMMPIAYEPNNPGNNLYSCVTQKLPQLKDIMENQYGIPFSVIKGWDMGEAPLHYYTESGLANSLSPTESILNFVKSQYPGTKAYISPYPLGNNFTYEQIRSAFDTIFARYPNIDMIIPQDSGGNPTRTPANNAVMFKALQDSVAAHPGKIGWANVETFMLPSASDVGVIEATNLYNPTTIDRLAEQINAAAPYVPKIVTWIYQHTMLSNSLYDNVGSWTAQYTPTRANARRSLRQAYMSRYGGGANNTNNNNNNNTSTNFYSDVPTTHSFYSFIEKVRTANIFGGCTDTTFCPDAPLTRAQAAVVLLRAKHGASYAPPEASSSFSDVPANYWAKNWIEALKNEGVVGGCGGTNFCPEDALTRAQAAVVLLRAKHGASYAPPDAASSFSDVPANHWAKNWIEALKNEGISSGCGGGKFCPEDSLKRGESAVFLVRAFPSLGAAAPTPVNGACNPTHYQCAKGNLGAYKEYATEWQWWCNGTGGGTNILCVEYKSSTATPTPNPTTTATPRPSSTATPRPSNTSTSTPTPTPITFKPGDLNKDRSVNRLDYLLFLNNFGKQFTIFDYNAIVTNYEK